MSSKEYIILKYFSERLKELIDTKLNISQKAFAQKIGITESYLSMVMKEKSRPSADMIASIYIHYGEHINWLLTGEETSQKKTCPICGDWSMEVKNACQDMQKVFNTGNDTAKIAIISLIKALKTPSERSKSSRKNDSIKRQS